MLDRISTHFATARWSNYAEGVG